MLSKMHYPLFMASMARRSLMQVSSTVGLLLTGNYSQMYFSRWKNSGHELDWGDAWAAVNLPVALMNSASSHLMVSLYSGMWHCHLIQGIHVCLGGTRLASVQGSTLWCCVIPLGVDTLTRNALCFQLDHTCKGCSLLVLTWICSRWGCCNRSVIVVSYCMNLLMVDRRVSWCQSKGSTCRTPFQPR